MGARLRSAAGGAALAAGVWLASGGCDGNIGPAPGGGDGSTGDGGPADGGSLPDGQTGLGDFGPATLIVPLSSPAASDDDATLTADRRELYFNSNRPGGVGGGDIWVSQRESESDPWGDPKIVTELSSIYAETTPEILADGLVIYFSSNRPGGEGGQDIYVSTRLDRSSAWEPPIRVPELSTGADDVAATPGPSHLILLLESDLDGPDIDLYTTTRDSVADPWRDPVAFDDANTPSDDGNPFSRDDGLEILFDSSRPGGDGGRDIWIISKPAQPAQFRDPEPVAELNSGEGDTDPWLSPDGRYIVFTSTRSGNAELYEASR